MLERFAPKIAMSVAVALFTKDLGFTRPSDSIDYTILERSNSVVVMSVDLKWSDVGSFSSLDALTKKDENGNSLNANYVAKKSTNNLVINEAEHTIATLGVSDLAIIHTHDATLIASQN